MSEADKILLAFVFGWILCMCSLALIEIFTEGAICVG